MRKICAGLLLLFFAFPCFAAKDTPFQTVTWPDAGAPMIRFTFSRFKLVVNGVGKEHTYITEAIAENLSDKMLGNVNMSLYVFDKAHVRIGDGNINLTNVGSHETVKFEMTIYASGAPASVTVAAKPPRNLSVTINSVPQGAAVTLDGQSIGNTPKIAEVTIGKHMLSFSKEGYSTGQFPFELGPHDTSGGTISYELGTSSHDTIELRDGSILSGDLISMDVKQVQIRVGGNIQTYERNQVKRVLLVPRDPAAQ